MQRMLACFLTILVILTVFSSQPLAADRVEDALLKLESSKGDPVELERAFWDALPFISKPKVAEGLLSFFWNDRYFSDLSKGEMPEKSDLVEFYQSVKAHDFRQRLSDALLVTIDTGVMPWPSFKKIWLEKIKIFQNPPHSVDLFHKGGIYFGPAGDPEQRHLKAYVCQWYLPHLEAIILKNMGQISQRASQEKKVWEAYVALCLKWNLMPDEDILFALPPKLIQDFKYTPQVIQMMDHTSPFIIANFFPHLAGVRSPSRYDFLIYFFDADRPQHIPNEGSLVVEMLKESFPGKLDESEIGILLGNLKESLLDFLLLGSEEQIEQVRSVFEGVENIVDALGIHRTNKMDTILVDKLIYLLEKVQGMSNKTNLALLADHVVAIADKITHDQPLKTWDKEKARAFTRTLAALGNEVSESSEQYSSIKKGIARILSRRPLLQKCYDLYFGQF